MNIDGLNLFDELEDNLSLVSNIGKYQLLLDELYGYKEFYGELYKNSSKPVISDENDYEYNLTFRDLEPNAPLDLKEINQDFINYIYKINDLLGVILLGLKNKNLEKVKNVYKFSTEQLIDRGVFLSELISSKEVYEYMSIENPYSYLYSSVEKIRNTFLEEYNLIIDGFNKGELGNDELFKIFRGFQIDDLSYLQEYLALIELDKPKSIETLFVNEIPNFDTKIVDSFSNYKSDLENKDKYSDLIVKIKFFSYFIENSLWYELLPNLNDEIKKLKIRLKNVDDSFSYKGVIIDKSKIFEYRRYLVNIIEVKTDLLNELKTYVNKIGSNILLNNSHIYNYDDIKKFTFPETKNIFNCLSRIDDINVSHHENIINKK